MWRWYLHIQMILVQIWYSFDTADTRFVDNDSPIFTIDTIVIAYQLSDDGTV